MPMYEYKCENEECKTDIYNEFLPMRDCDKEVPCPECGKIGKRQYGCNIDKTAAAKWKGVL